MTGITVGTPNQLKIICRMEHRLICRTTQEQRHNIGGALLVVEHLGIPIIALNMVQNHAALFQRSATVQGHCKPLGVRGFGIDRPLIASL